MERYRWLAGVIAAHPKRQVHGRTRLQKSIRLLQSLGLPTDYEYVSYFYGPYSEALKSDIALLEQLGLVTERPAMTGGGEEYYLLEASAEAQLAEIEPYQDLIRLFESTDSVVLELAATYLAYRELGCTHEEALRSLREKKGQKCDDGKENSSLELLGRISLPNA